MKESYTQKIENRLAGSIQHTRSVFARFPLVFTLLGSFGLVATLYGFEGIIDRIDLFKENPFILLVTGVAILMFTGRLYKALGDRE